MTARRFALGIPLATLLAVPSVHAHVPSPTLWRAGQPMEAEPRSEAAEAFEAGEAAFEAGDYDTAIAHFSRAQALLPHPHTAHNLGLAQARAGEVLEAWATFTTLRDEATDPRTRAEAELQLARLSPQVARVEVHAAAGLPIHIDDAAVEPDTVITRTPGPARIQVGHETLDVELDGGELRVLDLRTFDSGVPGSARRGHAGVLAATVAFGLGTVGTATATALIGPDGRGQPFAYATAGLGATTVVLATTALVLHLQDRRSAPGLRARKQARRRPLPGLARNAH